MREGNSLVVVFYCLAQVGENVPMSNFLDGCQRPLGAPGNLLGRHSKLYIITYKEPWRPLEDPWRHYMAWRTFRGPVEDRWSNYI